MRRLLAVDGLDGCGKDAYAKRISSLMRAEGHDIEVMRHPSDRIYGRLSKRALEGSGKVRRAMATLFFTLDVLASVSSYKRKREGTVVFVRYLLGTAYLPRSIAPAGYRLFRNLLPFPDLAIFIDIEPAVALRRIEERDHTREMFETLDRLQDVRAVARQLTKEEWATIDNSEDGEAPFARLRDLLMEEGFLSGTVRLTSDCP